MKGKRWLRRLVTVGFGLAVGIPLVGFGVSNLYLASPKGRVFVASKVQQRISLETTVMGSSWSPWNGISVYGIRVEQPGQLMTAVSSPLLQVESIRTIPSWRALIVNRQLLLKDIEIYKPKLVLPIELLSQLPSQPPVVSTPPAIVQVEPTPQTPPASTPPAISKTEAATTIQQEKPISTIESVEETTIPTVWIKFSDGGLKIVSTKSKKPLYQISNIEGAAPLGGKHASSEITLRQIKFLGNSLAETMTIPLKWRSPNLEIGAFSGKLSGMNCQAGATIGLTRGIPFRINAVLPSQENQKIELGEKLNANFANVVGQGVFQGHLAFPATWQGQWIARASSIDTSYASQTAHFDQGQAMVVFRNGALSCVDARLVGESLTLIGNATLLSDGRAASNARIIAAPETLVAISKFTEPDSAAPTLTPLSTPQRSALDLQIFGKLGEFYFKPNPRAAPIPLN